MEILTRVKATKETFSTKESMATALTNQQRFYKYKTPGHATHWSAHGYKPTAHFCSIFLFSSPPIIIYFGCLYFSLYLFFSKQVWQLNHFGSPDWCWDCSARVVLTGTRPGKTNTQVPEVRISGYQWAATAIWHSIITSSIKEMWLQDSISILLDLCFSGKDFLTSITKKKETRLSFQKRNETMSQSSF